MGEEEGVVWAEGVGLGAVLGVWAEGVELGAEVGVV